MKYTFGKIGLGLAGAVAAVGLISASPQSANAEITLQLSGSPVSITGGYAWTYTVDLGADTILSTTDATNTTNTSGEFILDLGDNSSLISSSSYSYSAAAGVGAFSLAKSSPTGSNDLWITGTYGSGNSNYTNSTGTSITIGTLTVDSTVNTAATPVTYPTDYTALPPAPPGSGGTTGNGYSADFTSQAYDTAGNPAGAELGVQTPDTGSSIIAGAPLPVAFWPGLLTLGGMAVVGGLRLRRRAL